MIGQVTLYDWYMNELSYGAQCRKEGYINVYDAMPEKEGTVEVIDREGNHFKSTAKMSFGSMAFYGRDMGYDICWWRYPR